MKMIEALSMLKGWVQDCDVGGWREDHCSHWRVSFSHSRSPRQVTFDRDEQINPCISGLP